MVDEPLDLRTARASTFAPHVGSEFRSSDPEAQFLLDDAQELPSQPGAPRPEPFSLVFTTDARLPQRIYSLEHPVVGRLDLFLVPVGPGPDGRLRYEAVFN